MWTLLRIIQFVVGCLAILCSVNGNIHRNATEITKMRDKNIRKRYTDFQNCIESFDIHDDKIIRTQDSIEMGAKYINEVDVNSREECLRTCCETDSCDVFVFEEKSPGSCYLFHCGPANDFKCKFTKHANYSSAVMAGHPRHLPAPVAAPAASDLEQQIRLTVHEQQLANLRRPDSASSALNELPPPARAAAAAPATVVPPPTRPPPPPPPPPAPSVPRTPAATPRPARACSRYQFECRLSGECIAIYNACDGIPQCADGSDEAPELDCPAQPPPPPAPAAPPQLPPVTTAPQHLVPALLPSTAPAAVQHARLPPDLGPAGYSPQQQQFTAQQLQQHQAFQDREGARSQLQQQLQPPLQQYQYQMPYQGYQNGGPALQQQQQQQQQLQQAYVDGSLIPHPPVQQTQTVPHSHESWQGQRAFQQYDDQGSHIFNHKGSGLVAETDRYKHKGKHPARYNPVAQYNEMTHDGYNKFGSSGPGNYYNNLPYQGPPVHNSWQSQRQPTRLGEAAQQSPGEPLPVRPVKMSPDDTQSYGPGPVPPDYFYDDSQERGQLPGQRVQHVQPSQQGERENIADGAPQIQVKHQRVQQQHHSHQHHNTQTGTVEGKIVNSPPDDVNSRKDSGTEHQKEYTTAIPKRHKDTGSKQTHSDHDKSRKNEHADSLQHTQGSEGPDDTDIIVEPVDGEAVRPSGAILSLALGLCVTCVMVILVGCRLRVVRKRLRRGGKSPYAHDADYLVNGMYL